MNEDIEMMKAHLALQGWELAYWPTAGYGLWHPEKKTRYSPTFMGKQLYCTVAVRMVEPQYIDPLATWDDLSPTFIKAAFDRSLEPYVP
jgi:hypothetical protein